MSAWWNPFAPTLEVYADHYAKNHERLRSAVFAAIEKQLRVDDLVLFVVHFPETYLLWQDELVSAGFEPELLKPPINSVSLPLRSLHDDPQSIHNPQSISELQSNQQQNLTDDRPVNRRGALGLVLSEMLDIERPRTGIERRRTVSIMSVQRHPLSRHDQRVKAFAKSLPYRVRLGYFLALDDPLVAPFLGEWTELLLEQWGFREANLITSDLVSRRLDRARQRMNIEVKSETLADQPRSWLEANRERTRYEATISQWLKNDDTKSQRKENKLVAAEADDDEEDEET